MKVAITGGRGRVSPILGRALSEQGMEVSRYSRRGGEGLLALDDFRGEEDVIIHCAWSSVPLEAEADPTITAREDLPLLSKIVQKSTGPIVFLSSAAVYGDTGLEPATETRSPSPLGAYARGKLAAEALLAELAPERALILRVTNLLIGACGTTRPQGVLPRMVAAAQGGPPLELWGDGLATKDYVDVGDFAEAVLALLHIHASGIYNIGSGESLSLREMLALVENVCGKAVPLTQKPHFAWDVTSSHVSIQKLMHQTDWAPKWSVREAVTRCVEAAK